MKKNKQQPQGGSDRHDQMRPSRRQRVIDRLLTSAGIAAGVASVETLGIGSAGLNARGDRDEDGTHHRLTLDDDTTFVYREYATTTAAAAHYQTKESRVFAVLRDSGLPTPVVLAATAGDGRAGGDPPGALLGDRGGEPLETVFRDLMIAERDAFWSEVGTMLRRLHDIDPAHASFLDEPIYQRPWTRSLPYFVKSLKSVRATRPDLGDAIAAFLELRPRVQQYLDERPRSICCGDAGYLPGMLLAPAGRAWECRSWLSLGYYVSINDPSGDVVRISTAHREWTGDDIPASFHHAYGSRPDRVATLLYGAASQLGRGASYLRHHGNVRRAGWGPPPHSTAIEALDAWPETVQELRSLLR